MQIKEGDHVGGAFRLRGLAFLGGGCLLGGSAHTGKFGQTFRQVVERKGRAAELFFQQEPRPADEREPRDAEGQLKGEEEQEEPDERGPHRAEERGEARVEGHAEHPSAAHVPKAEVPRCAEGDEAGGQQRKAAPAPPRHGEPRGDAARAPGDEDGGPDQRGEAEDVHQKPAQIRAEESGVVLHDGGIAHGVVDAGIVLIEGHQAEQHQQSPENEKEPKQLPGDFSSVRNGNLPRPFPAPHAGGPGNPAYGIGSGPKRLRAGKTGYSRPR